MHEAPEGRANPQGISYIYFANNKETAVAEMRPWLRATVTVAEFRTLRPIKLIDCSSDKPPTPFLDTESLDQAGLEAAIWGEICEAFAKPITRNDRRSDYVATQVLAELFRINGFDGIAYKSSLMESGHNLVLYKRDLIEIFRSRVVMVSKIMYSINDITDPLLVRRKPRKRGKRTG